MTTHMAETAPSAEQQPTPVSSPIPTGNNRTRMLLAGVGITCLLAGAAGGYVAEQLRQKPGPVTGTHASVKDLDDHDADEQESAAPQVVLDETQRRVSGIRTEPVTTAVLQDRVWRTGSVRLNQDRIAHLATPVDGLIREVHAEYGQTVQAGDILAVVDSKDVGRAKLDLMNARLTLAAGQAQHEWVQRVTTNARALWKELAANRTLPEIQTGFKDKPAGVWRDKLLTAYARTNQLKAVYEDLATLQVGAVPEVTVRKARAEAEIAEAQYRAVFEEAQYQLTQDALAAEQKFREAKATVDTARAQLLMIGYSSAEIDAMDPAKEGATVSHYLVRVPFGGVVIEKHAVRGERVTAEHQLFQIADLRSVWVEADIFEVDLPLVRDLSGQKIVFRAPTAGLTERPAKVNYLGELIDPRTRTLPLVLTADNSDRMLKPGLFVEVGLLRGSGEAVVSIPASALQRHENRTFVFVRTGEDTFQRVDVRIGRTTSERVEILSGIAPGVEVAVEGTFTLKTALLKDQIGGD